MCNGMGCEFEISTGPRIGACSRPHNVECPEHTEQLTCGQCGNLVEDDEWDNTDGYCYTCVPEDQ